MARKSVRRSFDEVIEAVRNHGFEVAPFAAIPGGLLVSKNGVATVLVKAQGPAPENGPAAFAEHPGILVRGAIARLLDRGYQKFIKTPQFELPATADQLHAIHQFSEELTQYIGGTSLYNQSLGTTSDLYQYDRLRGREENATPQGRRPWELASGH